MRRNKVWQFTASDTETPNILLKNPEEVKGEKEAGGKEKQLGAWGGGEVQREKIQSERKKDKSFEGESGVRMMH